MVAPAIVSETQSRFVNRIEAARKGGTDIRNVITRGLEEMLGETAAHAVIYIAGEKSLDEPKVFANRITEIFGMGAQVIFARLSEKKDLASGLDLPE